MTGAQVVLGAMNYGTTVDERRAVELLDTFVEHGGTWIDTADCYSFWNDPSGVGGASEHVLGSWLAARPGAPVKISTKVRHQPLVPHRWPESAEGLSAGAIRQGVAGSLERLGVESVDLLWAHAEDRTVALEETVATFGELVKDGTVRAVGASNHAAWRVAQARDVAAGLGVSRGRRCSCGTATCCPDRAASSRATGTCTRARSSSTRPSSRDSPCGPIRR
jgi:aryl-alcohol dehydrogenase-like predicted oxidoreductase